jgi:hypothetical protein
MRRLTLSAGTASARAAATRVATVISDIAADRQFAPYREFAHRAGFQAILAIPMITHAGTCVGVVSTYFDKPHAPTVIEQRMLETYGKIAADRIVALLGPEPISLRAQNLFIRALESEPSKNQRVLGGALRSLAKLYHRHLH